MPSFRHWPAEVKYRLGSLKKRSKKLLRFFYLQSPGKCHERTSLGTTTCLGANWCGFFLRGSSQSAGESGFWPQALELSRIQAPCCLSATLIARPGDELSREFTGRLDSSRDKGTRAQHGPGPRLQTGCSPSRKLRHSSLKAETEAAFSKIRRVPIVTLTT